MNSLPINSKTPFATVLQAASSTPGLPILDAFRRVDWKKMAQDLDIYQKYSLASLPV
jgi:hypothetical protein